jgi:hypothetical protein
LSEQSRRDRGEFRRDLNGSPTDGGGVEFADESGGKCEVVEERAEFGGGVVFEKVHDVGQTASDRREDPGRGSIIKIPGVPELWTGFAQADWRAVFHSINRKLKKQVEIQVSRRASLLFQRWDRRPKGEYDRIGLPEFQRFDLP